MCLACSPYLGRFLANKWENLTYHLHHSRDCTFFHTIHGISYLCAIAMNSQIYHSLVVPVNWRTLDPIRYVWPHHRAFLQLWLQNTNFLLLQLRIKMSNRAIKNKSKNHKPKAKYKLEKILVYVQCEARIMQYPLSPVTAKRSSATFSCGARSCSANSTEFGVSERYNQPGIGLPAQSALSSNSCRYGACGSGSAKIYR